VARISGVDLPRNKRMEVALTYLYGIGRTTARKVLNKAGVEWNTKSDDLTETDITNLRAILETDAVIEGDRRREVALSIKRLVDLGCYRGLRHRKGLPVRGQRTQCNARTRKGKSVAIAGKKSIKSMK